MRRETVEEFIFRLTQENPNAADESYGMVMLCNFADARQGNILLQKAFNDGGGNLSVYASYSGDPPAEYIWGNYSGAKFEHLSRGLEYFSRLNSAVALITRGGIGRDSAQIIYGRLAEGSIYSVEGDYFSSHSSASFLNDELGLKFFTATT